MIFAKIALLQFAIPFYDNVVIISLVTHLVVNIQLPHRLFLVSHNPYQLDSVLAHLPPLACKHIKYIHTHTQT